MFDVGDLLISLGDAWIAARAGYKHCENHGWELEAKAL